jgi:hypothetical protein
MTVPPSPITHWLDSVIAWLLINSEEPEDGHRARDSWLAHNNYLAPVVTLLGAYDSAKSALVRRLLVDAGQRCPEWLTISARHETFEVMPINIEGVLVRDTPGLAPNADDPRGLQNNARALAAAHLTDVLMLVMPPQLATGELESLQSLLDAEWPPGSLRCIITRFDEAGVDPVGDPTAYQSRAEAKVRELRAALQLSEDVSVHVIAPDAYQIAGEDRQPDPAVWDDFRGWDGVAQLRASLSSLASPSPTFRDAAGLRYFTHQLQQATTDLHDRQQHAQSALKAATQSAERHGRTLDRLNDLRHAARIKLDGQLATLLDLALHAGVDDPERLSSQTVAALNHWLDQCELEVKRLMQDFETEFKRQMSRPAWRDLALEFQDLGLGPASAPNAESSPSTDGRLSTRLRDVNTSLAKSLQDVRQVWAKRTSDFSAKAAARTTRDAPATGQAAQNAFGKAEKLVNAAEVFVVLGPTLVEIQTLLSDLRRERAQEQAQRDTLERIERRLAELGQRAGDAAFDAFGEYADAAQAVITSSAVAMEELVASLRQRDSLLTSAHEQAQQLLAARPGIQPA